MLLIKLQELVHVYEVICVYSNKMIQILDSNKMI